MEHTDAYADQYDVKDAENKDEFEDYFIEDAHDGSDTCNDEFGSKNGDDEELESVRKVKNSMEEINRHLVLVLRRLRGLSKGRGLTMTQER